MARVRGLAHALIETARLRLRPFTLGDAPFIVALVNDPDWLRHIGDKGVRTLDDARRYLAEGPLASYERHGFGLLAVEEKDGGTVGMCGVLKRDTLPDPDVGFAFLPAFRRRGYAREALQGVVADAALRLGLARLLAITSPGNAASIALLESVGFVFERKAALAPGAPPVTVFARQLVPGRGTPMTTARSLGVYLALTFALFWGALALGRIRGFGFFAPIAGALAPGVAALVVTGIAEGEDAVRALLRRFADWRVAPAWYAVALGLPLAGWLVAVAVATPFGAFSPADLRATLPVLATSWIMFLFAAVEEMGWRGFALPRLLMLRRALAASLILGTLHAVWHWPAVVPGPAWADPARLLPGLLRGSALIIAEAVLITWIFLHTRGSLLPVTLYHGMTNVALALYQGIDGMPWLRTAISVAMATGVVLAKGPALMRTRARDDAPEGASG